MSSNDQYKTQIKLENVEDNKFPVSHSQSQHRHLCLGMVWFSCCGIIGWLSAGLINFGISPITHIRENVTVDLDIFWLFLKH